MSRGRKIWMLAPNAAIWCMANSTFAYSRVLLIWHRTGDWRCPSRGREDAVVAFRDGWECSAQCTPRNIKQNGFWQCPGERPRVAITPVTDSVIY